MHLWTKVRQIMCACVGVIAICSTAFRLTMSCCPEIFAIKLQNCAEILMFLGKGPQKFV